MATDHANSEIERREALHHRHLLEILKTRPTFSEMLSDIALRTPLRGEDRKPRIDIPEDGAVSFIISDCDNMAEVLINRLKSYMTVPPMNPLFYMQFIWMATFWFNRENTPASLPSFQTCFSNIYKLLSQCVRGARDNVLFKVRFIRDVIKRERKQLAPVNWVLLILAVTNFHAVINGLAILLISICYVLRFLNRMGMRVPYLPIFYKCSISFAALSPRLGQQARRENGYSKVYILGTDVPISELEDDFNLRNTSNDCCMDGTATVVLSYKHFANREAEPPDDRKISVMDLRAVAVFIKQCGTGRVRFWIDSKLPATDDGSFERWLRRGVFPYTFHLVLLCPSASQHAQSSFWINNELHVASGSRAVLFFRGDNIILSYNGPKLQLTRRFLEIALCCHPNETMRAIDIEKSVHWALACISRQHDSFRGMMGNADVEWPEDNEQIDMTNIWKSATEVVRKYGNIDIVPSLDRNWNPMDLLFGVANSVSYLKKLRFYGWCCISDCKKAYLHPFSLAELDFETLLVLEVTLNRAFYIPCRKLVLSKQLRMVETDFLLGCTSIDVGTIQWT